MSEQRLEEGTVGKLCFSFEMFEQNGFQEISDSGTRLKQFVMNGARPGDGRPHILRVFQRNETECIDQWHPRTHKGCIADGHASSEVHRELRV